MLAFIALLSACHVHRPPAVFRVVAATPDPLLRAPDAREAPFPEVLGRFTPLTSAWVELRPGMELRIENAYFREGSTRRGLADFLGTAVAHYQVRADGMLRRLAVQSAWQQYPVGQAPVEGLISNSQTRYRYHRFFYEILLNRKQELRGAVLLGAASAGELEGLTATLLADPASVCGADMPRCTVFPPSCIVSLEIEIVVNGMERRVLWGSSLSAIVPGARAVEVWRRYCGRLVPVQLDAADPGARRLPLLPGDRVNWQ